MGVQPGASPERAHPELRAVRELFTLVASSSSVISPDDLTHLPDDLVDWRDLVERQWPPKFQALIANCRDGGFTAIADDLDRVMQQGPGALTRLMTCARRFGGEYAQVLSNVGLQLAQLIEESEGPRCAQIGETLYSQVNRIWNEGANKACEALGLGAVLFVGAPVKKAPELEE